MLVYTEVQKHSLASAVSSPSKKWLQTLDLPAHLMPNRADSDYLTEENGPSLTEHQPVTKLRYKGLSTSSYMKWNTETTWTLKSRLVHISRKEATLRCKKFQTIYRDTSFSGVQLSSLSLMCDLVDTTIWSLCSRWKQGGKEREQLCHRDIQQPQP